MFKRSVLVVLMTLFAIGASAQTQDDEPKVTWKKNMPRESGGVPPAAQIEAVRKAQQADMTPAPAASSAPSQEQKKPDAGVPVKTETPEQGAPKKTKADVKPASDVSLVVADVEPIDGDPSSQSGQVLCYVKGDPTSPSPCQIERLWQLEQAVQALEAEQGFINTDIGKLAKAKWKTNPFPEGNESVREANVVLDGMSTSERKEQASDDEPWANKLARLEREAQLISDDQFQQVKLFVDIDLRHKNNEARKATSQPVTAPVSKKKQGAAQSLF